jgi:hypothetical protein
MNRRQLIGATSAVLAATALPALADDKAPSSSSLVSQARAALDRHKDRIRNFDRVAIVDFGLHSSKPRFHLIDVNAGATSSFLVAHGRGSDPAHTGWLKSFSNVPGSDASSEGAYLTGEAYIGKHGNSRRLIGLDGGNSNALSRGIVIHSAWYVTPAMAAGAGIGRSEGCFALSEKDHATVMNLLGPDRLLLAVKA